MERGAAREGPEQRPLKFRSQGRVPAGLGLVLVPLHLIFIFIKTSSPFSSLCFSQTVSLPAWPGSSGPSRSQQGPQLPSPLVLPSFVPGNPSLRLPALRRLGEGLPWEQYKQYSRPSCTSGPPASSWFPQNIFETSPLFSGSCPTSSLSLSSNGLASHFSKKREVTKATVSFTYCPPPTPLCSFTGHC